MSINILASRFFLLILNCLIHVWEFLATHFDSRVEQLVDWTVADSSLHQAESLVHCRDWCRRCRRTLESEWSRRCLMDHTETGPGLDCWSDLSPHSSSNTPALHQSSSCRVECDWLYINDDGLQVHLDFCQVYMRHTSSWWQCPRCDESDSSNSSQSALPESLENRDPHW